MTNIGYAVLLGIAIGLYCVYWIYKSEVKCAKNRANAQRFRQIRKQLTCKHDNIIIKVLDTCVTCETTVQYCTDCQKELSKKEIDC
jgi:hypothetical protein